MLVLSRKVGESIDIGENVQLQVLDVRGGRVRLGVSAPTNVPVRRTELGLPVWEAVEARSRQNLEVTACLRKVK